eukprot:scaffold37992_cov60-Phaeocystis_antarctica.AAC.1
MQPACKVRPYEAKVKREGKLVCLGFFATAEEAALHFARTPEAQAAAAMPAPMTAEEALAQAEVEGLTLVRSDGQSGFRNVAVHTECKARPYQAWVWREDKKFHLGCFATAEEAALHVARTPEAQADTSAAAALPMTAMEAVAQAEAEGLTLARSDCQSGFRNVHMHTECKARPYQASVWRDSKTVHLGYFATAEEAALHVARTPEAQAAAALPPPMTAEEAVAQAEAEGLTIARSDGQSGFRNVTVQTERKARPYQAWVWREDKKFSVGCFATAEEAALHVARTPEAQAAVALPPSISAEEAVAQAEAEGLTLTRSDNQSGFRNVAVHTGNVPKPYQASVRRDGKNVHLGSFATAEEAALHVARTPEARARKIEEADRAALPPPMTPAEALAEAEAEGLTLPRSSTNQSGFCNVSVDEANNVPRPYKASVRRGGKKVHLGSFAAAEEAALHAARTTEAQEREEAKAKAHAKAQVKAKAQAQAQARAEAKLAAKAAAARARQEQKLLFEQHRQQLEQQRQQMGAQQAQLLRAAAEAQRQRKQGGAPPPAAAASGGPAAAAAEPATGSTDALVQQVLRRGGCPFRCLGLERGASQESVRKRYLALALRLHPDKAQHPQADEAFAALEGAYSRAKDAAAAAAAAS